MLVRLRGVVAVACESAPKPAELAEHNLAMLKNLHLREHEESPWPCPPSPPPSPVSTVSGGATVDPGLRYQFHW